MIYPIVQLGGHSWRWSKRWHQEWLVWIRFGILEMSFKAFRRRAFSDYFLISLIVFPIFPVWSFPLHTRLPTRESASTFHIPPKASQFISHFPFASRLTPYVFSNSFGKKWSRSEQFRSPWSTKGGNPSYRYLIWNIFNKKHRQVFSGKVDK